MTCTQCDSPHWQRCDPGQACDATSLTPEQRDGVLLFPSDDRPAVAWCAACDPLRHLIAVQVTP